MPISSTIDDPGTALGGLAEVSAVSPLLAGAYLGYLALQRLIPAVLVITTIRGVPAGQRSALPRAYLRTTGVPPRPRTLIASADPATAAEAGGDDAAASGDDE